MEVVEIKSGFKVLPAMPGTCSVCATKHAEHEAHNYWSLFYQMHFRLRYGRDATNDDALAHLPGEVKEMWRDAMLRHGRQWISVPDGTIPIAEPYAEAE